MGVSEGKSLSCLPIPPSGPEHLSPLPRGQAHPAPSPPKGQPKVPIRSATRWGWGGTCRPSARSAEEPGGPFRTRSPPHQAPSGEGPTCSQPTGGSWALPSGWHRLAFHPLGLSWVAEAEEGRPAQADHVPWEKEPRQPSRPTERSGPAVLCASRVAAASGKLWGAFAPPGLGASYLLLGDCNEPSVGLPFETAQRLSNAARVARRPAHNCHQLQSPGKTLCPQLQFSPALPAGSCQSWDLPGGGGSLQNLV